MPNRIRVLGLLVGAALVVAVAAASRAPWRAHPLPDGVLRLSLSARPERVERCRTLSAEELASKPAHMRQAVVCEGAAARYRLVVTADGAPLLDQELTGGGARRDRPLHLLREFPLPAGSHHLSVSLVRVDAPVPGTTATTAAARGRASLPDRMQLDTTLALEPHRVALVTYDPRQRRLLALTGSPDR